MSPTPPFAQNAPRMRLAGLLIPVFLASFIITPYLMVKGFGFIFGTTFFADPLIQRGLGYLDEHVPGWKNMLLPQNFILKGVPTNAQLTATLLRLGELKNTPLPPPPASDEAPPEEAASITEHDLASVGSDTPLNASIEELSAAVHPDEGDLTAKAGQAEPDVAHAKSSKHGRKGSRILGLFKGTAKAAVQTAIGADALKAKAGSQPAKGRLGAVSRTKSPISGPVLFRGRLHGRKGYMLIEKGPTPTVSFTRDSSVEEIVDETGVIPEAALSSTKFSILIDEIRELKKIGGYGWKAKLVIGWALDREVADGLEIVTKDGQHWTVMAMPQRDELFNRLLAIGGQRWESL